MLANWNGILSIARSEPLTLPGLAWPVEIRAHPRARALRLRLDEGRGLLTLTCPRRVSRRAALDWAQRQASWVEEQLAGLAPAMPFAPGAIIPLEGRLVTLSWRESGPRTPNIVDDQLRCGGPETNFAARIERYLRKTACERLSQQTAATAARAGVTIRSVAVGDASSRWGSCSASGSIRYSWRLLLAPPHLLNWVVAHEIAHRVHMDHSPAFRALEARLFEGEVAVARAELRALGPGLKRIGRRV
ncbi:MAG: M48 family metallopeptidase [Sphingomicrobium sp.]